MNLKKIIFTIVTVSSSSFISANTQYIEDIDLLNAGHASNDKACWLNAPFGSPLNKNGDFLPLDICEESFNYTYLKSEHKIDVDGQGLYLTQLSTSTLPNGKFIRMTKPDAIKVGAFIEGKKASSFTKIQALPKSIGKIYSQELNKFLEMAISSQHKDASNTDNIQMITTLSFAKQGTRPGDSSLMFVVYTDNNTFEGVRISEQGVSFLNEKQVIAETKLLINPLFNRDY
ncbi:hypothetical protein [Marinomonas sp. 2405UD68-3]|uniref:hypothetical protein n=1 Tax=Marinomonas sp. 2405UD68-3 TaxID=3391835 RepID=UPI0039C8F07A